MRTPSRFQRQQEQERRGMTRDSSAIGNNGDETAAADREAVAEREAERARNHGTRLIRSHLSSHLEQNPDSSFVTWIATLHPENASVRIDERFLIPGNPWWTVYEEATKQHKGDFHPHSNSIVPTATAVPVEDPTKIPSSRRINADGTVGNEKDIVKINQKNADDDVSTLSQTRTHQGGTAREDGYDFRCINPLASIVGMSISLASVITTFSLEISSLIVYSIGAVSFRGAMILRPFEDDGDGHHSRLRVVGPLFVFGYVLLFLLYLVMTFVDSLLLAISILVTEVLAVSTFVSTLLLGGIHTASQWHQYVRRMSHLTRWAFRSSTMIYYDSSSSSADDDDSGGSFPPRGGGGGRRVNLFSLTAPRAGIGHCRGGGGCGGGCGGGGGGGGDDDNKGDSDGLIQRVGDIQPTDGHQGPPPRCTGHDVAFENNDKDGKAEIPVADTAVIWS